MIERTPTLNPNGNPNPSPIHNPVANCRCNSTPTFAPLSNLLVKKVHQCTVIQFIRIGLLHTQTRVFLCNFMFSKLFASCGCFSGPGKNTFCDGKNPTLVLSLPAYADALGSGDFCTAAAHIYPLAIVLINRRGGGTISKVWRRADPFRSWGLITKKS